MYIDILAV